MESFLGFAKFNTGQVAVRNSIINPLLWLAGPMAAVFLTAAVLMPDYRCMLIILSFIPCIAVLIAYLAFAISDPDRLQSEEYQLQQQKMVMQSRDGLIEVHTESSSSNPLLGGGDRA